MKENEMKRASSRNVDSIKSNVVSRLSWTAAHSTNLYIQSNVLERGKEILAYKQQILLERDTIMVFADEAPRYNWAHPCRYMLHDADTGELYQEVKAQFPPYLRSEDPETYKLFHESVPVANAGLYYPVRPKLRCPIRWTKGQRYAVLFSGASNNRHTNDLEFLYRTLVDIYGFSTSNIYVLNHDGTVNYNGNPKPVGNWPGDNTPYRMPISGQGNKADLDAVLDALKARLKSDDLLLIHTNNHGGHNGTESYLCTYTGPDYLASDFANKLSTLPKFNCLMVMMEQCHSGGFNTPILNNSPAMYTSVSSACEELKNSIGGAEFDPFARDWIAAITGNTPYGGALASNPDLDGSGKVSAREAHQYADMVKNPADTPVYDESSVAAGDYFLGQRYSYIWPIYCRVLIDVLQPHYRRIPIPEFHEKVRKQLLPELQEVEADLVKVSNRQEKELHKTLASITKRAMRR
jgi:hypothetical protein